MLRLFIYLLLFIFSLQIVKAQPTSWNSVEQIIGTKGETQNDILKINFLRSDLNVKINDIPIDPELAANSWVAFRPMGNETMIMGELTLKENEVEPVISALVKNGFDISALHNLFIGDSPRILDLHFESKGNAIELARKFKNILNKTKTPILKKYNHRPNNADWTNVEQIIGYKGKKEGSIIEFSIPRANQITESGMDMPPYMDTATLINIQKIGNKAAASGDFILTSEEVNPVIQALTRNGIKVTAIHNHMLNENPRMFFVHFWGYGNPDTIANGIKTALDKTYSIKTK